MRLKLARTTYSESYESFTDAGNLESAIDELREKSDLDIADFKTMLETAYRDKVTFPHYWLKVKTPLPILPPDC